MAAQGILNAINGIIVGKPKDETYYEEYKKAISQVIVEEEHLTELPIIYKGNVVYESDSAKELQTFYTLSKTDTYTLTADILILSAILKLQFMQ